jgi:hypothetical protein
VFAHLALNGFAEPGLCFAPGGARKQWPKSSLTF